MSRTTGSSPDLLPWRTLFALFGSFAFAGYYPDLAKPYVHPWVAVGIFMLPVAVLIFVHWGEQPDRWVARMHFGAASWFLLLSAGMEIGIALGHEPPGTALYRVLAHVSWTFSWAAVLKKANRHR
jgi:hypothetical protein